MNELLSSPPPLLSYCGKWGRGNEKAGVWAESGAQAKGAPFHLSQLSLWGWGWSQGPRFIPAWEITWAEPAGGLFCQLNFPGLLEYWNA